MIQTVSAMVSDDIHASVNRFLCLEGSLLDRRMYLEWLELCTEDVTYSVTMQVHKDAATPPADHAIIDEDSEALRARIQQIATPRLTHAENPATLARRFFSGLRIEGQAESDEVVAWSNVMVFRTRPDITEGALYVGERSDTLRRYAGEWRLARRFVRLDHTVLRGAVSIIF